MKFGMNLLLWTGELNEGLLPVLESLKKMGYDGVELPLFNTSLDYAAWGRRLDEMGLERTAVTVRGEADNPISPDPAVRCLGHREHETRDRLLPCGWRHGAGRSLPFRAGLLYRPRPHGGRMEVGRGQHAPGGGVRGPSGRDAGSGSVEPLRVLPAEHPRRLDALCPRGEPSQLPRDVRHVSCAHRREEHPAGDPRCAPVLCHVHISENDRSTPGQGNVRWAENFDTLKEIGYDGWLTIEAFGMALPELVAATKIWRRMYQSEEQLARDGLAFMKAQHARRWA